MLAFDDAALARLVRGAREVSWRKRRAWLREIAAELDPPRGRGGLDTTSKPRRSRSPAARRQARVRARRRNGVHVYRLELADRSVEGLLAMMIASGRLSEREALQHQRVEAELARLLQEQGERWSR